MVKNQINKKKIYSKKRLLRGGEINTAAVIDDEGIHGITKTGFWVDKEEQLTEQVCRSWFDNLKNHPNFDTHAFNADDSVKGTANGLENIAICESILNDDNLKKLPVENVDDSAGDDHVSVPETLPVSSVKQTEIPSNCEELERILTLMYNNIIRIITERNNGYITQPVIKEVEEVFDSCAKNLVDNIKRSSLKFIPTICKEISELCKVLVFKTLKPNLQAQSSSDQPLKKNGFFIGIEKHYSSGFLTPGFFDTCHSLKLFDDFLNSFIKGVNEKNISIPTHNTYFRDKRLFLVLLKIGDKYKSSMSGCRISLDKLSSNMASNFLFSGLPKHVYDTLPYDIENQQKPYTALQAGGSKSRRRHRHKHARKTTRKYKSKPNSKPKTHRRRRARHSRTRKHKKYTRKY